MPARGRLVVQVGGAPHSVDVEAVREVLALPNLTPVPTAPAEICGVTQVRGQVLPVIDLALGLGLPVGRLAGVAHPGDPVVVVEVAGLRAALAVEEVAAMAAPDDHAPRVDLAALLGNLRRLAEGM